jgi:hypothetical protein
LAKTLGNPPAGNLSPENYEIAPPLTYSAFGAVPAQRPPVEAHAAAKPEAEKEPWSDAHKKSPDTKGVDWKNFAAGSDASTEERAASALEAKVSREKRAVWVVHGMGQQIPFETVDSLTQGLLNVIEPERLVHKPRLRTVKIDGVVVQRVELDVDGAKDKDGRAKNYELHLYESYWAPKTEGVAKLTDVVGFLWDGGSRGLLNSVKKFKRAMFGGMAQFLVPWRTPFWLCLALLVLAALTVINGVILMAAVAQSGLVLSTLQAHWDKLTALTSCMLAVAISFGALLFISDISKPQELSSFSRVLIGFCCWTSAAVTILSILKTAALMAVMTHTDWLKNYGTKMADPSSGWLASVRTWAEQVFESIPAPQLQGFAVVIILAAGLLAAAAMFTRAVLRSSEKVIQGQGMLLILSVLTFLVNLAAIAGYIWIWRDPQGSGWELPGRLAFLQSPLWVWPFLIAFSAKVRELMVQYVGDVAIYVTSNKLDRFDEVRGKIKEAARSVASAVFTAYEQNSSTFLYEHVAVVGHSLGSVIAYDTLNRLMLDDWLADQALGIARRAKTMVTFGSPLNKTAFLFTIQGKDSMHIRERLASTVQPLIVSYPKFRKLKWINVYSRNDIISGPLEFYDLPGFQDLPDDRRPGEAVENVRDKDAAVPIVAHVSYWKNKLVWQKLLSEIAP